MRDIWNAIKSIFVNDAHNIISQRGKEILAEQQNQREMKTEVNTVNEDQFGQISILKQPEIVGGYRFGSNPVHFLQLNFTYKPNWFHRTMMRICLDMHWFDTNTKEK